MDKKNICPFCGQSISPEKMEELQSKFKLSIEKEAHKEFDRQLSEYKRKWNEDKEEEINNLIEKRGKKEEELRAEQREDYFKRIDEKNKQIEQLKDKIMELERLSQRKTSLDLG